MSAVDAAPQEEPMFGLFKKQTRNDPLLGTLERRGRAWTGRIRSPLFPGVEVKLEVAAASDPEFAALGAHVRAVAAHAGGIRAQLEAEALETYRMYAAEEGATTPYPPLASPSDVGPLLRPERWRLTAAHPEWRSQITIDFGWPNPHFLVARLSDAELYELTVEG